VTDEVEGEAAEAEVTEAEPEETPATGSEEE